MINYFRKIKHSADSRYGNLSRFGQFCFVGLSGMCVDLAIYKALIDINIPMPASRALAIWVAMTWNFWINRRVTFNYSKSDDPFVQYIKFVLACMIGAIISYSISVGLPYFNVLFAQHIYFAAIIGIVAGTFFNFITSLLWVFKKR